MATTLYLGVRRPGWVLKSKEDAALDGSAASFWPEALPWAKQVHATLPQMFISDILSQWAAETGYGGTDWSPRNNPGNVGDPAAGGQTVFPTLAAGVQAYINTLRLGYYTHVLAATTWETQAYALGASPWAGGHYIENGVPGQLLVEIIEEFNLTQYDGSSPAPGPSPKPTPAPTEEPDMQMDHTPSGNGYTQINATGAVFAYGDAQYFGGVNNAGPGGATALVSGDYVTDLTAHPTKQGYWVLTNDGYTYCFGGLPYYGSEAVVEGEEVPDVSQMAGHPVVQVDPHGKVTVLPGDPDFLNENPPAKTHS